MERREVTLTVTLVVEVPAGIDSESHQGQDYLRPLFIDYLKNAENIQLAFDVGEQE